MATIKFLVKLSHQTPPVYTCTYAPFVIYLQSRPINGWSIAAMAIQNYKTFCAMLHQRVHNAMQNHIQSLITNINTSLKA